jgi:hypothetical protein
MKFPSNSIKKTLKSYRITIDFDAPELGKPNVELSMRAERNLKQKKTGGLSQNTSSRTKKLLVGFLGVSPSKTIFSREFISIKLFTT